MRAITFLGLLLSLTTPIWLGAASQGTARAIGKAAGTLEQCVPDENTVCTTLGGLRGTVEGDLVAFKGIPYAQPPVGPLRWRPPQPLAAWGRVRDASTFGPVCPQQVGAEVVGDEDCLTLNIWTPRQRSGRRRPVMIYFTGGGNHGQSGQGGGGSEFTGRRLIPHGVLLVTVNIRLGALGFLSHPALDAEAEHHVSGNYGTRDHLAILRWVQQHIAAFGGDPGQVTLFGTSAGGATICGLITSPLARGLFHRAVIESAVATGCQFQTPAQAQSGTGAQLARATRCDAALDVPACLRAVPVDQLVRALRAVTNLFPRTYGPVIDGDVYPDQPITRIVAGQAAHVPVIIGNTLEETASWLESVPVADQASYRRGIERIFGKDLHDQVLAQYPAEQFSSPQEAFLRTTTDAMFTCSTRRVARALVAGGVGPVFRYLFAHHRANDPASRIGHSTEMPYLFQSWTDNVRPGSADLATSEQMILFWTRFATTGRPIGPAVAWTPITRASTPYMELGVEPVMKQDADAHCDFWDTANWPQPHL